MSIPYSTVNAITFYINGDEENEIDASSVIIHPELYKGGTPYPGGVYDLKMGTTDPKLRCGTCLQLKNDCTGHSGVIHLRGPVKNPLWIKDIQRWLKVACWHCGLPVRGIQYVKDLRSTVSLPGLLAKVANDTGSLDSRESRYFKCFHCSTLHPVVTKDVSEPVRIQAEFPDKNGAPLVSDICTVDIRKVFNKISDETVRLLGRDPRSGPKKLTITKLKAPGNSIRPDIRKAGSAKSDTSVITTILQSIVKDNDKLPNEMPEVISDAVIKQLADLELKVFDMIKGSSASRTMSHSKEPIVSIAKRIPKKTGRVRRNLMGKRTFKMARSFITCNVKMAPDEVGIPVAIARNIQFAEVVQPYNYDKCLAFFNNKRNYPGCTEVLIKATGELKSVQFLRDGFQLQYGDTIYRDFVEGDILNFNRQPSLETSAICSMRIRILYDSETFQMNILSCPLFNADFDGDEMNLLFSTCYKTINEITRLSSPAQRFINYKTSSPVIGEAQDSVIGTAKLTRSGVVMNKLHAMRLLRSTGTFHDFGSESRLTGADIVSILLAETGNLVNLTRNATFYDEKQAQFRRYTASDTKVSIIRGKLVSGVLDKSSIGQGATGNLFHVVASQFGPQRALDLAWKLQQIALEFLVNSGITVSARDFIIKTRDMREIQSIEASIIAESIQITETLNSGGIIPPLGKTIEQHYEALQIEALKAGDRLFEPLLRSIDPVNNNFDQLIVHGSKGSMGNFNSVATAIGQIEINGDRLQEKLSRRVLPYFQRYTDDPAARGYVQDCFAHGMSLKSLLIHSQDVRYQLINTALATSITGTNNRCAIKNLESNIVDNMRRVSKGGKITQFIYGSDGVDPRYLEKIKLPILAASLTDAEFKKQYSGLDFEKLAADREFLIGMLLYREHNAEIKYDDSVQSPVNVKRILDDVINELGLKPGAPLDAKTCVSYVNTLCEDLPYCFMNEIAAKLRVEIPVYMKSACRLVSAVIRCFMNHRNLEALGFTVDAVRMTCELIRAHFSKSLIDYGTAVGIIAAQCVSEPLSQRVISSKHFSGVSSTKKQGMVRVREILSATERLSSPTMNVFVRPEWFSDKKFIQDLANKMEMLTIGQFISYWQIFYEGYSEIKHSAFKHEQKMIDEFEKYRVSAKKPSDLVNWCVRFQFNKHMLIEKNMRLEDIYAAIRKTFPHIYPVYNNGNSEIVVMRLYFRNSISKKGPITVKIMEAEVKSVLGQVVRGIQGVNTTYVKPIRLHKRAADGSITETSGFYIFVEGSNLYRVLLNPYVDRLLTKSDGQVETQKLFGIEAARLKTIHELYDQVNGGASYRHFTMYADETSFTGRLTSIDRYGSAKRGSSVMLQISDANPITVIESAAANCARDDLSGISPAIMIAKNPAVGDHYNTFLVDSKFVCDNTTKIDDLLADI